MAKKIVFETEVRPGGVDAGLRMVEAKAAAANGRMNKTVYEAQKNAAQLNKAQIQARGDYEGRIRGKAEGKAAFEEQQKANNAWMTRATPFTTGGNGFGGKNGARRNFGASSSMFVSVARDSAASLASGAPITQVIAQQAPQVLQALSMMRLGMVAVGIAAAGVGAFIAYKIVRGLYEAYVGTEQLQKGFRDVGMMSDRLANKIEGKLIAALRSLANASKNLRREKGAGEFDLTAGDAKASLETAIERSIFLSQEKNHTLAEQIEHEKKLLEIQARRADAAVDLAKKEMAAKIEVADAAENLLKVQQDVDKEDESQRSVWKQRRGDRTKDANGNLWTAQSIQAAEHEDQKRMATLLNDLDQAKKDLAEAQRRNGQGDIDEKLAAAIEIRNRILELEQVGKKQTSRGALSISSDSLSSVGNFLGQGRGVINGIQQQQLDESRKQTAQLMEHGKKLDKVVTNTQPSSSSGGSIDVP